MKKLVLLLAITLSFFSCSSDDSLLENEEVVATESANKLEAGSNVKLHKAWIGSDRWEQIRIFHVEVANLAYNKEVDVVYEMEDGTWVDFPLSYSYSTPDNTEIWTAEYNAYSSNPTSPGDLQFGNQFAIRYKVDGQEYWDNNNWNNYSTMYYDAENNRDVYGNGTILRDGINVSVDTSKVSYIHYTSQSEDATLNLTVNVKNLAFDKEVKVVYTTDGWNTVQEYDLSYVNEGNQPTFSQELGGAILYNTERWRNNFSIPVVNPSDVLEYVVVYKVNGQEYWDNNFGQNFKVDIVQK